MVQIRRSIGWCVAASVLMSCGAAHGDDPVFDVRAILAPPLDARVLESKEADGIVTEHVMFYSHTDGEKRVEIFGIFSYPKGERSLPAFVWNQSGLAQASDYFPTLGAKRGYAALCIDFPIAGYRSTGGYPINGGLALPDDPRQAPIYHGAVALLRAVSYLESREQVDASRIGMAGSSWGGFYTTMMAGVDKRLKVASSMFGCGALHLGNAWWDGGGPDAGPDAATRERWRTTLDPAWRLPNSNVPIGWFTGANEWFYRMPGLMKSYEMAGAPKHLSLEPNWDHGLPSAIDEQVFAWLDVHLKGERAFLELRKWDVAKLPTDATQTDGPTQVQAAWLFSGPRKIASSEIHYSYGEPGSWSSRFWITEPATRDGLGFTATVTQRQMPCLVYASVIDEQGFRYSTPIHEIDPRQPGEHPETALVYNSVSQWGDFETEHVDYLQRMAYMRPVVSDDAHTGEQSAELKPGKHVLGPVLYTPGVAHRFTAYLKADQPSEVTVKLVGLFDGVPSVVEQTAAIGPEWSAVSLDITPPNVASSSLRPHVIVPDGATVLIDTVTLGPIQSR